jgi:hypothetical protein
MAAQSDLQYKRQYIGELQKRLMAAEDENRFLQQEMGGQMIQEGVNN